MVNITVPAWPRNIINVRANDKVYIVNSLLMFCSLPYFPSYFRLEFFFCFAFREHPFFSLCFRSNRFLIFCQCTWSACGSEVTKRREYDLIASKASVFFARSPVCLKKAIFLCEWPLLSSIQEDSVNILGKLRNFPGNRLVLHNLMGRIAQCVCISRSLYHTAVAKPWPHSFRTEFQRFSQVRYKI